VVAGVETDRRNVTLGWHVSTGLTLTVTDMDAEMFFALHQARDNGTVVPVVTSYYCGDMRVRECDGRCATLVINGR